MKRVYTYKFKRFYFNSGYSFLDKYKMMLCKMLRIMYSWNYSKFKIDAH